MTLNMFANSQDHTGKQPAQGFIFPELPYAFDALEPYIDRMTMEIHYTKHHRAYYDNFLKAIAGTDFEKMDLHGIFSAMSKAPAAIRNNGGGYYNHILFWENMAPEGKGGKTSEKLASAIHSAFGSFDEFVQQFSTAGKTRFGSGWAWLCTDGNGALFISSTPNQDNPLMDVAEKRGIPLLALDVWEHAYYLKYQNRRPDYVDAFWKVVNWEKVNERFAKATGH